MLTGIFSLWVELLKLSCDSLSSSSPFLSFSFSVWISSTAPAPIVKGTTFPTVFFGLSEKEEDVTAFPEFPESLYGR